MKRLILVENSFARRTEAVLFLLGVPNVSVPWNTLIFSVVLFVVPLAGEIPSPDIAISMGCNVGCPYIGKQFNENWGIKDPTEKSDGEFEKTIEKIRRNIIALKERLDRQKL